MTTTALHTHVLKTHPAPFEAHLVTVMYHHPYSGMGTGMAFSYERVEKGIAWDGTLLLRQRRYMRDETIEPWPGEFRDKGGETIACIPATKQNEDAVREFSSRVDKLRDALAGLLRPAQIMRTLTTMGSIPLLSAPGAGEAAASASVGRRSRRGPPPRISPQLAEEATQG